jgi:hypothetical protein
MHGTGTLHNHVYKSTFLCSFPASLFALQLRSNPRLLLYPTRLVHVTAECFGVGSSYSERTHSLGLTATSLAE